MPSPEDDYRQDVATMRQIRGLWALVSAVAVAFAWLYSQVFTFATWRSDETHYKQGLEMRLDAIEAHARLHAVGQHEKTRRQRVKDVREMVKQLEAIDVELLKLVPGKRRERIRRGLSEHRARLMDSMLGD